MLAIMPLLVYKKLVLARKFSPVPASLRSSHTFGSSKNIHKTDSLTTTSTNPEHSIDVVRRSRIQLLWHCIGHVLHLSPTWRLESKDLEAY